MNLWIGLPFETAASLPPLGEGVVRSGQHTHDVAFLHDQELLAVELDLGAGPFVEQHAVADLEVDRDQLAGLIAAAGADRRDFALRGLFLGRIRNDDAALGLRFGIDALDHNTVMQRTKFGFSHEVPFAGSFFGSVGKTKVDREYEPCSAAGAAKRIIFLAIALSEC